MSIEYKFQVETPSGKFSTESNQWLLSFLRPIEESLKPISSKELHDVALIIQKDIIWKRIFGNRDIWGHDYRSLRPVTIRRKGHAKPLIHKYILARSIEIKTARDYAMIYVGASRAQIAIYLQYGTRYMRPLSFFGISLEAEKEIDLYFENKLKAISKK